MKNLYHFPCFHMHLILQERATDDSKESESFKELLTARTQEFIEEILSPHFGGMITFVKEAESMMERGAADSLKSQESMYNNNLSFIISQNPA